MARTRSTGNSLASNVRRAAATAWGLMSCAERKGIAGRGSFQQLAQDMSAQLSAKCPKSAARAPHGPWQYRRGRASSWPGRLLSSPTRIRLPSLGRDGWRGGRASLSARFAAIQPQTSTCMRAWRLPTRLERIHEQVRVLGRLVHVLPIVAGERDDRVVRRHLRLVRGRCHRAAWPWR